jgi:hypothetical protein
MREGTKYIVLGLLGLAFIFALVFVGSEFGWWLDKRGETRRTDIIDQSPARQAAFRDEVLDLHGEIADLDVTIGTATEAQRPALEASRNALVERFCVRYSQLSIEMPTGVINLANQEC